MAGLLDHEMANDGHPQEIEVPDKIQDLVAHEFVLVPETFGVEHATLVQDDGALERASPGEAVVSKDLHVFQEPECPGSTDLADVCLAGKLQDICLFGEEGVAKVDGVGDLELPTGVHAYPPVTPLQCQRFLDEEESLEVRLEADADLLEKVHEGSGTPVHDGYFRPVQGNEGIVDPHAGKSGHEVLHGGYHLAVTAKSSSQLGVDHMFEPGRDGGRVGMIHPAKTDAAVGRQRPNAHGDLLAGVKADPRAAHLTVHCPLVQ